MVALFFLTKQKKKRRLEMFMSNWNKKSRKNWWVILFFLAIGLLAGFFVKPSMWDNAMGKIGMPNFINRPFKLGLDLQGGTHLVYEADLSGIDAGEQSDSMQGVRDVIERRINLFGVQEPVVQINKSGDSYRLIVELAGIKDVHQAIEMIGQTPTLDFREERSQEETDAILEKQNQIIVVGEDGSEKEITQEDIEKLSENPYFKMTSLTGRYLKGSELHFDQQTYQSKVGLEFNDEGKDIFKELTQKNIGKKLAIFLDGVPISAPTVNEAIPSGKAEISGEFTIEEAKELVRRLNAGALPVPIDLINQQTIGASLGKISLDKSLQAGILGFVIVLIFMIFSYKLPGLIANFSLLFYAMVILAIFKLVPVTLTLAGIAGFILSIGMAVDANVLIFERFKEALRDGKSLGGSIDDGFKDAWPAIRDGNISTIITCIILYTFATGAIQGFALTLSIGVIISMFSAVIVTKNLMKLFIGTKLENWKRIWK
ncbi:protein translocase subunit SecD [Patescibacteria group bacterium]